MRSIKLLPIAAAAAMLSVLAPTGASARPANPKHSSPSGPCRVLVEAPRGPITYGDAFSISGHLACPKGQAPQELGNKQVTIYQRAAGSPGYVLAGSTTTETNGAYAFTPPAFSTNSTFFVLVEGARSAHRTIRVSPLVSLTTPSEGTKLLTASGSARTKVEFTGTVSPLEPHDLKDATVTVQQESSSGNEEWRRIGNEAKVHADGTYSIPEVFHVPGTANLRVVVHPNSRLNATGASSPVPYVISQPQNPQLAINSSVDPLTYGESTSITGEVAPGRGQNASDADGAQSLEGTSRRSKADRPADRLQLQTGAAGKHALQGRLRHAHQLDPRGGRAIRDHAGASTTTALTTSQPITLRGTVTGAQVQTRRLSGAQEPELGRLPRRRHRGTERP